MAALEAMRRDRDRFVAFAFASADMLLELDGAGNIHFADGATMGLLGISPKNLVGSSLYEIIIAEDSDVTLNMLQKARRDRRVDNIPLHFFSHTLRAPVILTASAFHFDEKDDHVYLSLSARPPSSTENDLRSRDVRTGTLKKEAFAEQANEKILEAQHKGEELEITLVDFPQLKDVLDGLNPEQSRQLLEKIGEYLRSKSVGGDMAATLEDGNSFSLLHDSSISAGEIISTIRKMVSAIVPRLGEMEATTQTLAAKPAGLTKQDSANALLFTLNRFAESHGEDFTIESLSDGYQEMLDQTLERINSFRDILNEEAFDIAFQPIVEIKSGVVHHFECLVRLKEGASKEFANPFQFITFGESAGLINEFDLLMAQKTLDILMEAHSHGNKPMVSVNVSGRSLSSSLFMDSFKKLVESMPKVRKQLIVEITESAKISDLKLANDFVQKLRKDGNMICLDDFGSGESSFDYLRCLQVDFVKIDGSYVKEAMESQHGRDMLKAMAGLCRSLNIVTIGEMVEDEKCAFFLWESGVKFGQGYFFGKPSLSATDLSMCGRTTPFYPGIIRAKRFRPEGGEKPWWWKKED